MGGWNIRLVLQSTKALQRVAPKSPTAFPGTCAPLAQPVFGNPFSRLDGSKLGQEMQMY